MEDIRYEMKGGHWRLSAGKAVYWEEERALIVADLHVGKAAHFRKAGIAVPGNIVQEDLYRLQQLITKYNPQRLIVVGDMFHSSANNEVQYFRIWRNQFPHIRFELVTGNHDIMDPSVYASLDVQLMDTLTLGGIYFVHDPKDKPADNGELYAMSGHIHPGVWMVGNGRQRLRLPCFYFGAEGAILPAFSAFTGTYCVEPGEDSEVFVIGGTGVFKV
ncbi:ligase-associated DNA damage response endonuclease PdeM [Chitinophaga deserti]|uniref:ligase-associated DNA damage response endonuclease PdeM n=1 Tax=Chitinophaga deserti TaxID=2164099 RepID=UPI000D6CF533|nr:ligase-associated DNA damage response endonuclease PdeM [Chitinophaga deserti]